MTLHRRTFILGGLAAAGGVALAAPGARAATPFPFKLGVTSGDPAPDSVVLWTRLAPSPLNADGQGGMPNTDVAVDWQVSATDTFATVVASGTVTAHYSEAHSVHVVAGGLNADAEYYYRFRAQGSSRRSAAPVQLRPSARRATTSQWPLLLARTTRPATTPLIGRSPTTGPMWCCTWATTSTRAPPAPGRYANTPAPNASRSPTTAAGTPNTSPTPICRPPTPPRPGSWFRTTTRWRTTTPPTRGPTAARP
jgi:PhoD-like phosphatase